MSGLKGPAPSTASDPGAGRALLHQRDFASLWWGQLISILGERLSYVAFIGLVAAQTHQLADRDAPLLLAALANVMAAPVLLAPVGVQTIMHPDGDPRLDLVIPALAVEELSQLAQFGVDVLIGRDVLASCVLVYDGPAGSVTLAY